MKYETGKLIIKTTSPLNRINQLQNNRTSVSTIQDTKFEYQMILCDIFPLTNGLSALGISS